MASPATAGAPWLSVSGGFASFTVPAEHARKDLGEASLVAVEGGFGPSFARSQLGLTLRGDAWTAVIGPLPPGLYHYRITGDDGRALADPTNPTSDGSASTWRTFVVPGEAARLLADVPHGQGGRLETLTYTTGTPHRQRPVAVWTPPGFDAHRAQPYPVLYLLAGDEGSHTDWIEFGRAEQIANNLAMSGRMAPMVVVMVGGGAPGADDELADVMRTVRDRYPVARDRPHQACAGVSEGGSRALRAALAHPGEFGYAGSFAGLLSADGLQPDAGATNAGTRLLRLYTGNLTDPAYHPTHRLILLRRFGIVDGRESLSVVGSSCLCLPAAAPVGPVQHVVDRGAGGADDCVEQAADLVAAQRDQRAIASV